MIWTKVGLHGWQSGEYRVAEDFLDGCTLYPLHYQFRLIGYFNSFEECREAAERDAKCESA